MGTPFMSEIKIIAWNFAPKGWSFCNGQFLPINQNQALFSLLGTTFGGNGQTTFALPDLRGRVPVGFGSQSGDNYVLGQAGGQEFHTVTVSEMPTHVHTLSADSVTDAANNTASPAPAAGPLPKTLGNSVGQQSPGGPFTVQMYSSGNAGGFLAASSISNTGGSQPHENRQPYLCLNFVIALQGVFPSQN